MVATHATASTVSLRLVCGAKQQQLGGAEGEEGVHNCTHGSRAVGRCGGQCFGVLAAVMDLEGSEYCDAAAGPDDEGGLFDGSGISSAMLRC